MDFELREQEVQLIRAHGWAVTHYCNFITFPSNM